MHLNYPPKATESNREKLLHWIQFKKKHEQPLAIVRYIDTYFSCNLHWLFFSVPLALIFSAAACGVISIALCNFSFHFISLAIAWPIFILQMHKFLHWRSTDIHKSFSVLYIAIDGGGKWETERKRALTGVREMVYSCCFCLA